MKQKKIIKIVLCVLAIATSPIYAAKSTAVAVAVMNKCNKPIIVHVDNNIGSIYTGNYTLQAKGSINAAKQHTDEMGFIFTSDNEDEYYTISYGNAVCKVDYQKIARHYFLDAVVSNCDTTPKCDLY